MKRNILLIASSALILDQVAKIMIDLTLKVDQSIQIIKNILRITLVHNYGAAFGILNNQNILLIILTIISLFIIIRFSNTFTINKRNILAFSLLIGGISGNLLDRLFLGYVRDFIHILNFPILNLSDIFIVIGAALIIYASIKGEDNDNNHRRSK